MLVLKFTYDEIIKIGDAKIHIKKCAGLDRFRLYIDAPKEIPVLRLKEFSNYTENNEKLKKK